MDLAFTPEEQQFREDIRAWVRDQLPADIAHKVHNALRLTRARATQRDLNSQHRRATPRPHVRAEPAAGSRKASRRR